MAGPEREPFLSNLPADQRALSERVNSAGLTDPPVDADAIVRLRHLVAERRVVFVIGAGVSMQLTGDAPTSSWRGFMDRGVAMAAQRTLHRADTVEWLATVHEDIASEDPDRRLTAEDRVLERLGGRGSVGVAQWLLESFGSLTPKNLGLRDALAALDAALVTLNYDNLLEDVTGRPTVTWQQPTAMRSVIQGRAEGIIHLHGHWSQPASVVLGTNEYERITSEREAQRLVEAISYGNALVLVGFGAPLDTVQFKALRTWLTTSPGERHLRLVTTHERARFSSAALVEERQHIDLIGYGDDFADLGPFLRSLVAAPVPPAERAPGSTIPPEREAVVGGVRLEPGDSHWVRRVGPLISTVAFVLAVFQALGIIGIATLMCAVSTGIAVAMLDDLFVRKRRTALRKAALLTSALAALACVTISFAAPEPGVGIRSPTAQTSLGNGSGGRNAPSAGFSPARPTYDYAKYDSNDDCGDPTNVALRRGRCGSRQPVYNSFVNVPGIGDEREFFDGFRSDHPQAFSVADPVDNVTGGSRKVVLRIYINNDARYDAARPRANAIHGALVRVFLPSTTGKSAVLRAYLSARNARTVSDSLVFTGTKPFSLQVVPRSAKLYTRNRSYPLDGEIVGHAGVAVGDRRPNGTVAASTTVGQATVYLTVRVIDG